MRIAAILNRDGGTLRSTDLESYGNYLQEVFSAHGHKIEVHQVAGKSIESALSDSASNKAIDAILCGGGDGSVSAAAGIAWKAKKALGVLPAGTMNLFARSLSIPLDIHKAAEALAAGNAEPIDIASANGRPFVHQFSVGLQPRIVKERSKIGYSTRIGKMLSGLQASIGAFRRPPEFAAVVEADGEISEDIFSFLAVSNNLHTEGHMPYPDDLTRGELGIYRAGVLSVTDNAQLASDLFLGSWGNNPNLRVTSAESVSLRFPHVNRRHRASVDGELTRLLSKIDIRIHPGELTAMVPKTQS